VHGVNKLQIAYLESNNLVSADNSKESLVCCRSFRTTNFSPFLLTCYWIMRRNQGLTPCHLNEGRKYSFINSFYKYYVSRHYRLSCYCLKHRPVFIHRTMDNVHKHNIWINVPSSQTFRSYRKQFRLNYTFHMSISKYQYSQNIHDTLKKDCDILRSCNMLTFDSSLLW
jgi:hypothetical protein